MTIWVTRLSSYESLMFRRNISPPSSGQKSEPSKEPADGGRNMSSASGLLVSLLAYEGEGDKLLRNGVNLLLQVSGLTLPLTVKVKVICCSETAVNYFCRFLVWLSL
jgi:hypothetical protein